MNRLNKILKDKRAQVSLEFLIILGIAVLVALAVGFYLKQMSAKNAAKANSLQDSTLEGTS